MKCLHPITVHPAWSTKKQIRYKPRYFNSYTVPCGKCPACLRRKQNDWAIRILYESKCYKCPTLFVTLTYSEGNLPIGDECFTLDKSDPIKFIHNVRQSLTRKFGKDYPKIRYFLCGEYGDRFNRPHYHCCIFGLDMALADCTRFFESIWNKGFVTVDTLTPQRAKYVAKYCVKPHDPELYKGCQPPFALMSRMPAIGSGILKNNKDFVLKIIRNKQFVLYDEQGTPYAMPRYYAERLFTPKERMLHSLPSAFAGFDELREIKKCAEMNIDWCKKENRRIENIERLFYKRLDEKLLHK